MLTPSRPTTTTAPTAIPTPIKTTKANRLPIQLELPLINESGQRVDKHKPCDVAIASLEWLTLTPEQRLEVKRYILPGLDADLCRCPSCTGRKDAQDGIWWFNADMRDRIRKRKIPYCFEGGVGDVAVEGAA